MIDFYRDSIDALGMNSRPSMNQLIHGEKARDSVAIGIEELKVSACSFELFLVRPAAVNLAFVYWCYLRNRFFAALGEVNKQMSDNKKVVFLTVLYPLLDLRELLNYRMKQTNYLIVFLVDSCKNSSLRPLCREQSLAGFREFLLDAY